MRELIDLVMILLVSILEASTENVCSLEPYKDCMVNLSREQSVLGYTEMESAANKMVIDDPGGKFVEKRSNLSLQEFWDVYDGKRPVVITDIIPQWMAYKQWSKESFLHNYADSMVAIKSVDAGLKSGHFSEMKTLISSLDEPTSPNTWKYMEDELFLMDKPQLRQDLGSNYIMEENFFHLFPEEIKPWDCMMLWGTKHSRSSLHMDPYNWTAVSALIWGKKHWKLYPPGQDQYLYIPPKLKCGFPLECNKYDSPVDAFDPHKMENQYPDFRNAYHIDVVQNRGELLVIPTGWFHQAYNAEETLSVSTQLMNRNNFHIVLEEIIKGGNIRRGQLPPTLNTLPAADQVKIFMSFLPEEVLHQGKRVTEQVLGNLNGAMKDQPKPP